MLELAKLLKLEYEVNRINTEHKGSRVISVIVIDNWAYLIVWYNVKLSSMAQLCLR